MTLSAIRHPTLNDQLSALHKRRTQTDCRKKQLTPIIVYNYESNPPAHNVSSNLYEALIDFGK